MSPRLTERSYQKLYSTSARLVRSNPTLNQAQDLRRISFVQFVVEESIDRWADVGANDGSLLLTAKDSGMDVMGLEPSESAMKRLWEVDDEITVHPTYLKNATDRLRNFDPDLVSLIHVFEHLPHPIRALKRLKITNTEYLLLEVPDAGAGLYPRIFREHGHLFYYTRESLENLLHQTGWECAGWDHEAGSNIRMIARSRKPETGQDPPDSPSNLEDRFRELEHRYKRLNEQEQTACQRWLNQFDRDASAGLYGAGSDGIRWWGHLREQERGIDYFIDRNAASPSFQFLGSIEVHPPSQKLLSELDWIIITPLRNRQSIARSLASNYSDLPDLCWVEPDGTIATGLDGLE